MAAALVGLAVGYLASRLLWVLLAPLFQSPVLARANFRGRALPTAAGLLIVLVAVTVEGSRVIAGSFGIGDGPGLTGPRALVLLGVTGFGVLGLIDDLLGSSREKGFRGHLSALVEGRLTTGSLKLIGGAMVAILVVGPAVGPSPGRLVVDALLVALSANVANLLDRAPGRTTKVTAVVFLLLLVGTGAATGLAAAAVVVGAALGLLPDELHERLMLGDTGSNVLGATLGLAVVLTCGPAVRDVALVVVVVINIAGELTSLGRVIEATPGLRSMDRLGRRR